MARHDGDPEHTRVSGSPGAAGPAGAAQELAVTGGRQRSRYWKLAVFGTVVAVLVIMLIVLLPPLIRPHHANSAGGPGSPVDGGPPGPPPGVLPGCPPPIGPPPDRNDAQPPPPPPGDGPGPGPGGGAGQPCPGQPRSDAHYRLILTGKQVDLPADTCHSGIDLDQGAITTATADIDLVYEPCGATSYLRRVPGRPFGAASGVYAGTGTDCRAHTRSRPLTNAPQNAPNLVGYCVITSRSRIAHVLVQSWGGPTRPNLRLQITLWQKS